MLLHAQPLTAERFRPYGDVIQTAGAAHFPINAGRIERFHDLATVDVDADAGGRALISIVKCTEPSVLPYRVEVVERHGLGSQAFIPLGEARMIVVVGPPGEAIDPTALEAFVSDGRQGINYNPGVWHMPLIAFETGQEFIVVDRGGDGQNCDEVRFDDVDILVQCATL